MNISALFIRRPVMTTLVMGGILVFGIVAYSTAAGQPTCRPWTIRPSRSRRRCPAPAPETMASSVATPLEKQFSTIAGLDAMTSSSAAGPDARSRCSSRSTAISTPPPQDVQAAITADAAQLLPQACCRRRTARSIPSAAPILSLRADVPRRCRSRTLDEYGETMIAQRISTVVGRRAGAGVRLAEVRRAHPARSRRRWPRARSASTRSRTPSSNGNVNLPTGMLWGTRPAPTPCESNGQLHNAAAFRPLIVAYRNGAPVRLGDLGHVVDSVQDTKAAAGSTTTRGIVLAIQRQPGTNTVEVADARARRDGASCERSCRRRSRSTTIYDQLAVDPTQSVNDVKFTLYLTLVPGRAGDLPLPAQRLGDDHPEPRAADVARRHLRRDVPARLSASTTSR